MKKAIIIATIISTAAVLGACRERMSTKDAMGLGTYVAPAADVAK